MQDYILNWSSSTKQTITLTPKVALDPGTTTGTSQCSIVLFGKGAPRYGEGQQENFIRMLENFSSPTAPIAPTSGQLWFDSGSNLLKVYDASSSWKPVNNVYVDSSAPASSMTFEGMLWYNTITSTILINQGGVWKSLGTSIPVAGVEEYNTMVASYNLIAGAPTDVSDRAASFNGKTSLIAASGSADFNLSTYTSGTIELWVLPKSMSMMTLIKQISATDPGLTAWRLNITERGTITVITGYYNDADFTAESSELDVVKLDEWNHIAVTFGSGNIAIFLNGKLILEKSGWVSPNATGDIFIGQNLTGLGRPTNLWSFYGLMDNVRITKDVVRYTADFDPTVLSDDTFLLANDPQAANVKFLMRMNTLEENTGKSITVTDVVITPQAFGYGQTELPTLDVVTNSSWLNLLGKFRNIAMHQGNDTALDNLSTRGFIIEPNASPAINCGLTTLLREYDKTEHAVNSLIKNSAVLSHAASSSTVMFSTTDNIAWLGLSSPFSYRSAEINLSFSTLEQAHVFFNSGGKIKISSGFSPNPVGANAAANAALKDVLGLVGDTYITGLFNTDTIYERGSFKSIYQFDNSFAAYKTYPGYELVDYGGPIIQNSIPSPYGGAQDPIVVTDLNKSRNMPNRGGYYALTSSPSTIIEAMVCQNNDATLPIKYDISANTQGINGKDVKIAVKYSLKQGVGPIIGSISLQITAIKPNSSYLNSPIISFPTPNIEMIALT